MSNSRWSKWSSGSQEQKLGFSKFFKEAQEQPGGNPTGTGLETPAQKAKRLGLVSDGHGAYSDPNTGQVVAKTINGELVFYDQGATGGATSDGEGGNYSPAGGAAPTYRDPETGMVVVPPATPKSPEEQAQVPDPTPASAPASFEKFMDKKSKAKKQSAKQAPTLDDLIAQIQGEEEDTVSSRRDAVDKSREAGLDAGDAHEAIHGDTDTSNPEQMAKLAATMGRVQKDGGAATITRDSGETKSLLAQDDDYEEDLAALEADVQKQIAELQSKSTRIAKAKEKAMATFRETLKTIPSAADKKSFLQSMAHAKTFEGRVNTGAGKNNLGYADVQALMANRDRLMEGYGDGSPETIEKFVRSVRSTKVSDEFAEASFEMLPDKFKKSLTGKGKVTGDKYVSDDKAHKDMHFIGYDENGKEMRGAADAKSRAKLMWKIYLEQGGRDAYTGLPLDLSAMDLEHVRGFNNKDGGNPSKTEWEQRENDKNFTLINSNVNQKKTDLSMGDFFAQQVDPNANKSEEEFGGIEKMFEKQNEIGSVADQLVKTMLGENGKGMSAKLTGEMLNQYLDEDDKRYDDLREEFRKVATNPKDAKKAAQMKSKMGKTLLKAIGLTRGFTDPSGRRTSSFQENIYRGFLKSMANAPVEMRGKYMEGWADGVKASNEERHPRGMIKLLKERGLIDDAILNDKKLGRVFKEEMYDEMGELLTEDLSIGYTKTELKNILHYGRRLRES